MKTILARSVALIGLTRMLHPRLAASRLQAALQALQGLFLPPIVTAINDSPLIRAIGGYFAASNIATDSKPESWVRIAPYGNFPVTITEKGQEKDITQRFERKDADEMVSWFNSKISQAAHLFRGLPIYVGHPDDKSWAKENPTVRAEAVGRIKTLEARADGLYGLTVYNSEGHRLLSGEAAPYTALSPRWGMRKETDRIYRPVYLHSFGLTNEPNISGAAIGLNEALVPEFSPTMKTKIIALLAALGRPVANTDTVTDDQLAAAVNEAVPVATAAITATNEITTLKTQLTTAQNEAGELKTQLATEKVVANNERAARADAVLTIAVNTGKITEAQRVEWKTKLISAPDFGATEKEIVALKPAVNTKGRAAEIGKRKEETVASNDTITAINTAVEKYKKEHGVTDHLSAYNAVRKAQPALFTATA